MVVGDADVFPGFPTYISTSTTFFPKPPSTLLTCFSRGERRKYAGKKIFLYRVSNSQQAGHESDTLTTEPQSWAGHIRIVPAELLRSVSSIPDLRTGGEAGSIPGPGNIPSDDL